MRDPRLLVLVIRGCPLDPGLAGLALRTNTLAWPGARERLSAHEAGARLGLIGVQRFGLLGSGLIHAGESTTYRRSQEKPRRSGAVFSNVGNH